MHVTQRTPDTLVVEEGAGTAIFFVLFCLGGGAISVVIGWTNEEWLFVIVGTIFALYGLKIFLFGQTRMPSIRALARRAYEDSKGLFRSRRRELPLDSIADILLEEIRGRGGPSYYIHYVTATGERIKWSDYYKGKANTLECFHAAREFLGIADAATSVKDEPARG